MIESIKINVGGTCTIDINKPNKDCIDMDIKGFNHNETSMSRNWIRLHKEELDQLIILLNLYKEGMK